MGVGSRLVSFEEAESLALPVVGYLSYDYAARLEPSVTLPREGHGFPESRLVVADTLVRFDHGAGTAEVLAGDDTEIAGRLEGGIPWQRETRGEAGQLRRFPERARYEDMVRSVKEHIVAGDVFQCVPSQRAERADIRLAARPLSGPAARQSFAVPVPTRPRRDRTRRLVTGAPRRVRGRTCKPLPDRRDDRAHGRRRRAAALVGEGPGRARDARRPRPQRPVARVPGRDRPCLAQHGGRALLACLTPRLGGRRRAPRRDRRPSTCSRPASPPGR